MRGRTGEFVHNPNFTIIRAIVFHGQVRFRPRPRKVSDDPSRFTFSVSPLVLGVEWSFEGTFHESGSEV